MSNVFVRRIGAVLLGGLILLYVLYQICMTAYVSVETETAVLSTLSDIYETKAYVIRNETVITGETNGMVVDYAIEDGGKVSSGGVVANLYRSTDTIGLEEQIERMELEAAMLQRLSNTAEAFAADPASLSGIVNGEIADLLGNVTAGDFSNLPQQRVDMLFRLNQMALITDDDFDYSARLEELESRLTSMRASLSGKDGTVTTAVSGVFSKKADGYESVFDYSTAEELTVEDLQKDIRPEAVPQNALGRVTQSHEWYIACVIDAETALKLSDRSTLQVMFPFVTSTPVTVKIAAINQAAYDSDAALILRCSTIDASLINTRCETIAIDLRSYTGVMVRQDAVRFEDITETIEEEDGTIRTVVHENVKGVYILSGNRLEFVQIFSVVSANGYVVCKQTPGENDKLYTDHTVQLYDMVVVKGSDLYDGKIL